MAILLVITSHCGLWVPAQTVFTHFAYYGIYGVQLFFVMSAFTLCHSIKKDSELTGRLYAAFMIRRFFRIAPLYYLAIPFYYFISRLWAGSSPTIFPQPAMYNWPSVLVNLLFVNGLCPFANNWVVPGGWTIGCEFLFYAMFPFLFFLARPDKRVLAATVIVSLRDPTLSSAFTVAVNVDDRRTPSRFSGVNPASVNVRV